MNRNFLASIIVTSFMVSCNICESFLGDEISPHIFSGTVINKNEEGTGCFGTITLQSNDTLQTMPSVNYYIPDAESLWDAVQIGDSINKPSGSILVTIYKKDTTLVFEYPCIVQ